MKWHTSDTPIKTHNTEHLPGQETHKENGTTAIITNNHQLWKSRTSTQQYNNHCKPGDRDTAILCANVGVMSQNKRFREPHSKTYMITANIALGGGSLSPPWENTYARKRDFHHKYRRFFTGAVDNPSEKQQHVFSRILYLILRICEPFAKSGRAMRISATNHQLLERRRFVVYRANCARHRHGRTPTDCHHTRCHGGGGRHLSSNLEAPRFQMQRHHFKRCMYQSYNS